MNTEAAYQNRLKQLSSKLYGLKRSSRGMALVRIAVFLILVASIIWVVVPLENPLLFLASVLGGIVVFLLPLAIHQKIFNTIAFTEALIAINENELRALKKSEAHAPQENLFSDGGERAKESALINDIDITGRGSLFHLLNRCVTPYGNRQLLENLIESGPHPDFVLKRQQAIRELTPEIALRQELTATALIGHKAGQKAFVASRDFYYQKPLWRWVILGWPFMTAAAFLTAIFVHGVFSFVPLVAWLVLQNQKKQVHHLYSELSGNSAMWQSYARFFALFGEQPFKSEVLTNLSATTRGAAEAIKHLAKISSRWDQRQNGLAIGVMNTLLLFDIKYAYHYEQWKQKHESSLTGWLTALGEIEALISFATFAYNHSHYSYPTVMGGPPFIAFQDMGHPLVASDKVITNSIELGVDGNVYVITGSNMSGKSTFLRGVGLNLILGQAGAPVFAGSMRFTPLLLLTSFRQSDSIQDNTSYFMAELKRLREIIRAVDSNVAAIILLDEILRGTNSDDKSHGSETLLTKLATKNAITLLATHDLNLGNLEKTLPGKAVNYCFESEITQGDLTFDYTIKRGIARNKNATFLMKKMGIV